MASVDVDQVTPEQAKRDAELQRRFTEARAKAEKTGRYDFTLRTQDSLTALRTFEEIGRLFVAGDRSLVVLQRAWRAYLTTILIKPARVIVKVSFDCDGCGAHIEFSINPFEKEPFDSEIYQCPTCELSYQVRASRGTQILQLWVRGER